MNAGIVIFILKTAVIAVTLLWLGSLAALALGRTRLHGRINIVFFALTLVALLGLEVITRVIEPDLFENYLQRTESRQIMRIHLAFSVPSSVLLFAMLFTGLKHKRTAHIATGIVFSVLWIGTFITGVFFLPHEWPW